jgi:hypothetical protein
MKLTITSLELKGALKFFLFSAMAMKVIRQMKGANLIAFKKRGVWKKHYTMSLWHSEEVLKAFARSGAHHEAMRNSKLVAKEIRTLTLDADKMPDWKTAMQMLEKGKVIRFDQ